MILQQFPFSAVTKKILAGYYSNVKENVPEGEYNRSYRTLFTDSKKGMIFDLVQNSSLLFSKVDINDIIDFPVDITEFKERSGQLRALEIKDNISLSKYETLLKAVGTDVTTSSGYNVTPTAIEKFVVFVKLVGLSELTLQDVYLSETSGEMSIEVTREHPIFTGTLRIKTW